MNVVIYPPTIDWDWMKQRPQQLLSQLSKQGNIIYYCNKTQRDQLTEQILPNLYIVHNHSNWLHYELPKIRETSQSIGVWCSYPKLAPMITCYQADWIIYDCIDEFSDWMPYEKEMITLSNGIVCSSERLYIRLKNRFPNKKITLIRNAYDPEMKLHEKEDSLSIDWEDEEQTKWVGYVGAWAPWVDEKLIKKISAMNSRIKVAVIGPEFGRKFHYTQLPHVRYLGFKPHNLLPHYIKKFSICIIPFRITTVTLATNPVKAYEYLASGIPTISTNLPESRLMQPHVDVATTHEQFIEHIKNRLKNPGNASSRIQYALENTWEHRSIEAAKFINHL